MLEKDRLACEISTLVYNKYLMTSYGIKDCNINFTVGDLREKIARKSVLDNGHNCKDFTECGHEKLIIGDIVTNIKQAPPPPSEQPKIIIEQPIIQNITYQTNVVSNGNNAFAFTQSDASDVWQINHNLGFNPNVTILDSNGVTIEGDVRYTINNQQVTIYFSQAIIGQAFLS